MTDKINITVTGRAGVGKSAISDLLYEFMVYKGFASAQVGSDSTDFRKNMTAEQKRNQLEYLKNDVVVIIDEKQAKRSAL